MFTMALGRFQFINHRNVFGNFYFVFLKVAMS